MGRSAVMTKPTVLNVLHILLGRRSSDEKCSKEGIENWAKKVFQGYRQSSFKEERLDFERPKRKLSDISESDFKDNVESVLDFLKNVHVATSLCRTEIFANILFALNENFFVKSHHEFANCVNEWLNTIIRNPSVSSPPDDDFSSLFLRYFSLYNAAKTSNNNVSQVKRLLRRLRASANHCRFNVPQVRTRLEKLMGTNCVCLTDRDYMQKLQDRILEDYGEQMERRIKVREEDEVERVKNLVLVGKIPLDQAPQEMAHHPMMLIENYCNQLIAQRRAKMKIYKVKIPTYLYWNDTPDPPSGFSIDSEPFFRQEEKFCRVLENTEDEDLEAGYVVPQEDYDGIKYENPLIKQLMICETVEEMYALADDIIGALKTISETAKVVADNVLESDE